MLHHFQLNLLQSTFGSKNFETKVLQEQHLCRNLADTPREGPLVDADRVSNNKLYWTPITMSRRVLGEIQKYFTNNPRGTLCKNF